MLREPNVVSVGIWLLFTGCSTAPRELVADAGTNAVAWIEQDGAIVSQVSAAPTQQLLVVHPTVPARAAVLLDAGLVDASGYVHSLAQSRFRIGQNVSVELNSGTLQRRRGTLGAFALDPTNGWTMGALDAISPTGPYILDEATSAQMVQAYFVGAGLPQGQIERVRASFETIGGGTTAVSAAAPLHSVNSVITRIIGGVPVGESYAWAKMTTSGDVDMESVFWPRIPDDVVTRAIAFATKMMAPASKAQYVASLPGTEYAPGAVYIHHTTPIIHQTPTAYVSYDAILSSASMAAPRHFDESGVEFRLPQETLPPPGPVSVK